MTRCEDLAPLLPDVADGAATPAESAVVGRHVGDCTHCRIQLAREQRLSRAICEISEIDVGGLFTAEVLERIPATIPTRRRDRRGLKLAVLAGVIAVGLGLAAPRGTFGPGLPSPAAPTLPADIADPAANGLIVIAQSVLMALQAFFEAPVVATTLGVIPLPLLLLGGFALLAGMAFSSALLVVLAGSVAIGSGTAQR